MKKEHGVDILLAVANIALAGLLVWTWYGAWAQPRVLQPTVLPPEIVMTPSTQPKNKSTVSATSTPSIKQPLKKSEPVSGINIAVPFMVQAPLGNWGLPYQEACEEASVAMAVAFVQGNQHTWAPEEADKEILDSVAWEQNHFGFYEDTTLAQVQELLNKKFGVTTGTVLANPSPDDLRAALSQGSIIIAPFYGRVLPNPHFSGEGPLYHMLVIKGYTADGFITNDPGTKFGHNFFYTTADLMNALHDWNGGNVEEGQKVVLVISQK